MIEKLEASNFDCIFFFFLPICSVRIKRSPSRQLPWNQWRWPLNWRFLMWTVDMIRFVVLSSKYCKLSMLTSMELD